MSRPARHTATIGVAPNDYKCYTFRVPTTRPRYTITDTGDLAEILDAAQRRWPEVTQRKLLLLRLAEEGHRTLSRTEKQAQAHDRQALMIQALQRIPLLVDRELLLSDRAWS